MIKREPLMDQGFFIESLEYIDKMVESRIKKLRDHPDVYIKPQTFLRANFRDRYEQVFIGYSLGEEISQLAARFIQVIDAYEIYSRCPGNNENDVKDLDAYIVALWLVSFAILFRVDDSQWQRLLACIGNEGRDALLEALIATRSPNRKETTRLLHEAIFQPLFAAITAKGESRDAFVKRYLKAWYKALKPTYWVDSHKGPKGGGFFGYWAVEVAGVVKAFDIDDCAFRDMPYYPRDLIA